jgi:ABC-type transporter Mla subunit MlaD
MKNKPTPTPTTQRSQREVMAAIMLEEIDALVEKVETLSGTIVHTEKKFQDTVKELEGAGDAYHQAVLAANLQHKNEMVAYLRTVSTTSIAKTTEEQREIVQKLIREAVSKEVIALKKALSESSANHRVPFLTSWGRIIICCGLTALLGSAVTVELIQRLGIT